MVNLLYLATPKYGGWVTFSAIVAKINNTFIYKITKRSEKKERYFGYDINYKNINIDDLSKLNDDIIILAIDKKHHHLLDKLPLNKCSIVIHDPTELKSNKSYLLNYLPKMKVITIRKLVEQFLYKKNILNTMLYHPYIRYNYNSNNTNINKSGIVSISRIDYDKHTEILLKVNRLLTNKIEIYGDKNDRFVYHKLKEYDSFDKDDINSCYKGRFEKSTDSLYKILKNKKFVIDLSKIQNDGGGTQYTFLEAIDYGCILILNKKWTDVENSIWKDGFNCLSVSDENDIITILNNSNINFDNIYNNSLKILETHCKIDNWIF